MNKNLERIEFEKVLEILAKEATSEDAKKSIKNIVPSKDFKTVKRLIGETSDAYTLSMRFGFPPFNGIVSVKNTVSRACNGATLQGFEFMNLLSALKAIRLLKNWKDSCTSVETSLDAKFEKIFVNKYLEKKIQTIVLSESEISDTASPELFAIRSKMRNQNQKIRKRLENIVNSSLYKRYLSDSVVTNRSQRFVIQVKSEHKNEIKGLVQGVSASGSTLFVEPMEIVEENNHINELKVLEKREIDKILFNLSREVENFAENILNSYEETVKLDEIFAKASLAVKMKCSVPEINQNGTINLKKVRHPLIPNEKVQPIDINLGENFDTLIITGPNTGGKTVAVKTVGLMCAMAMSGMMIPALDGSQVSVFDEILADIGDEQSIEQSVSTFSSHMKNIVDILKKASDKTLVMLDEIGSGTDPEEGASLSMAILDNLRLKKAKIIATTHYKELKEYAVSNDGVECASCEFDLEKLKPTYKILIGSVGNSNAFLISEKLGLSVDVIENAKNILGEDKVKLNDFLIRVEKTRKDLEEKTESTEKLYLEAKNIKEEVNKEKIKLNKEREKILEEARFKAKTILDRVKIETENLIKDLNKSKNQKKDMSPEDRRKVKEQIRNLEDLVDPLEIQNSAENLQKEIHEGDKVFILGFEKEGIVCSGEDEQGNFLVAVGKIKTKVPKSRLRPKKKNDNKKGAKNKGLKNYSLTGFKRDLNKKVGMEIDLRGKTVLEAYQELEIFLDTSFLSGMGQITVIHGKGSGNLRKGVHDILRKNRQVKNFRPGDFNEGGDGVTIVTLKGS